MRHEQAIEQARRMHDPSDLATHIEKTPPMAPRHDSIAMPLKAARIMIVR